jgi:hypothetical protein
MVVQKQNDQKVTSHIHAKGQRNLDEWVIIVQQCPPLPKPTLVKLFLEQLL